MLNRYSLWILFDVVRQFKIALHDVKNKNTEGVHVYIYILLERRLYSCILPPFFNYCH
jgi:hypothetical protein